VFDYQAVLGLDAAGRLGKARVLTSPPVAREDLLAATKSPQTAEGRATLQIVRYHLAKGSLHPQVRLLQGLLTALSVTSPGPIDGVFGPQTEASVGAYQDANGLVDDGKVGPVTWELLERGEQ
jgi:peptidoglycan hydrolase-like protein with peptidoglycan-binding domain